jgi:tRNA-specific 2-thiouridylase
VCDSSHKKKYLSSTKCEVSQFNWINHPPKNKKVKLRFRHRQNFINGTFLEKKNKIILNYSQTLSVTPGQFVVFYQGEFCLGGGIVDKIIK